MILNAGGVGSLYQLYHRYRALTGQPAFDLTPRDLMMRMAALDNVRDWRREDIYRGTISAGAEITIPGGDKFKDVYL